MTNFFAFFIVQGIPTLIKNILNPLIISETMWQRRKYIFCEYKWPSPYTNYFYLWDLSWF